MQHILQQAMQLHEAGRLAEAEKLYAQLLALDAKNFPALHLLGMVRLAQGRPADAADLFARALKVRPGVPETLINHGIALASAGKQEEALPVLRQAAKAAPNDAAVHGNLGALLHKMGRNAEALDACDAALARNPKEIGALLNRSVVLNALGRHQDAIASFDRTLAVSPRHAMAFNGRGLAWHALRKEEQALADFDRFLQLQPDHLGGLLNRASALWALGRFEDALADYNRLLALEPNQVEALTSRSSLLWTHHQALEPALADTERLAALAPDLAGVPGDLLHLKMYAGDWTDYARDKAGLDDGIRAGKPVVQPFPYQGLSDNPADLLACARMYADFKFPAQPPLRSGAARRPGKIRVGYVSGEFRAQATAYLAAGLYEAHDRSRFEIIAIDNTRREQSPTRARLEAGFDRMIDITALSDAEAAQRIKDEDIDILVNLNGYFGALRMGVFAYKPAPIQVNYLGFPGTLGAPYMDYILADGIVIPPGEERFYIEQVARLPHSYQINDNKRAVPPAPPPRADLGLPPPFQEKDGGFVFCHFNYSYKITPDVFAVWMRLLAAVPGSVLWLLQTYALFGDNLRVAAAAAGIDPARLIFAPTLPMEAHVARLAAGDLFLDSLPYGAHTTGSDALWAGLPLLTCRGHAFAGRVGASLLTALELPELIAEDLGAYEARALELARDPTQLAGLRARLAQNRATAPLFDTARTTRDIETAYQAMFDRWQSAG